MENKTCMATVSTTRTKVLVTFRPSSMFEDDIKANGEKLTQEIKGKKVCKKRSISTHPKRGS